MPSPADVASYLTVALAYFAAVAVPLGLLGSAFEYVGKATDSPKIERVGKVLRDVFMHVPGLLTSPKGEQDKALGEALKALAKDGRAERGGK